MIKMLGRNISPVYAAITVLALCWTAVLSEATQIRIGAFNIKSFGDKKMGRPDVADRIKQIVSQYDIILLQEVRDKDESSLIKLQNMLNSNSDEFLYIASDPLGRSRFYREQYAYFYRKSTVDVIDFYQFNDANYGDVFEREPFSVLVRVHSNSSSFQLVIIGLHAKPSEAVLEINALDHVVLAVLAKWQVENLMVLGDLNADCTYAKKSDLEVTSLFTDFQPLIGHKEDTTVGKSECAYDRINVHGSELKQKIVGQGIDNFEVNMGLTNEEALAVSDHFPVDVVLSI